MIVKLTVMISKPQQRGTCILKGEGGARKGHTGTFVCLIFICLIFSLEQADASKGGHDATSQEFQMILPPPENFKDVHGGTRFPHLTEDRVEAYLILFGKKMESKMQDFYNNRLVQ